MMSTGEHEPSDQADDENLVVEPQKAQGGHGQTVQLTGVVYRKHYLRYSVEGHDHGAVVLWVRRVGYGGVTGVKLRQQEAWSRIHHEQQRPSDQSLPQLSRSEY